MGGKIVAVLVSVALVCASAGVIDAGPSGGALPPQLIQVLEVAGDHGVPDDAEMVAVNVAAVTPAAAGHLTVYPCDHDVPTTSNLNYLADDVVPNFALVRIADDGTICIATHAVADLVVDVVGYVPAGSSITALDAPVRVTDTRSGVPIQAGNLRVVDLSEVVEPDATMAMFNLTSVRAEARGHATVFPCTADVPNTSSLNYERRRTVANFVVARLSPDRSVCVYSHATSDFVIDVVASTADGIVTLDRPVRVRDTREQGAPIGAGDTLELDLVGLGGVPDDATAAVYNLTAASASARGHATSYPCDGDRPEASNLNYRPGRSSANSTITKLSASGRLCIDVHAATHLVVDLIGYTTDDTHYVPLTPTRALDTRNGWQAECPWIAAGAWESLETGHLLDIHPIDGSTPIRNTGFYDYSNNLRPGSSLDCEHVVFFGAGDASFERRLVALSTRSEAPLEMLGDSIPSRRFLAVQQQLDRSYLAVDADGRVIDAVTGAVRWEHPEASVHASRAAISRNGLVALRTGSHYETTNRDGEARIEVWDVETGEAVSSVEVPLGNIEFDLSPDGNLLAIDLADDVGVSPATVIATVFGAVVETRPTEARAITRFLGPGVVVQCIDGAGLTLHDLFGPWSPGLLPHITPEAATYGVTPCRGIWP